MKFIKYIAATLLLTVAFTSCQNGNGVEDGTVGVTTVQFAQDVIESGYSSEYISIPVTITADTEEAMNSRSVSVKVIPVVTNEEYEGVHNETGLEGDGDYCVTSWELYFPPYDSYYDKNDPQKYYDVDSGKWVKTVNLEIKIMDDSSDELHINFMIESTTATAVGARKMCKLVLKKTTRDRLQGLYQVSYDEVSWLFGAENKFRGWGSVGIKDSEVDTYFPDDVKEYTWDLIQIMYVTDPETGQSYFVIASDYYVTSMFGAYLYGYFDAKLEQFYLYPMDFLGLLSVSEDESSGVYMTSALYDTSASKWAEDERIYLDFDIETGVLSLPEQYAFGLSAFELNLSNGEVLSHKGEIAPAYKGLKFTKVK